MVGCRPSIFFRRAPEPEIELPGYGALEVSKLNHCEVLSVLRTAPVYGYARCHLCRLGRWSIPWLQARDSVGQEQRAWIASHRNRVLAHGGFDTALHLNRAFASNLSGGECEGLRDRVL